MARQNNALHSPWNCLPRRPWSGIWLSHLFEPDNIKHVKLFTVIIIRVIIDTISGGQSLLFDIQPASLILLHHFTACNSYRRRAPVACSRVHLRVATISLYERCTGNTWRITLVIQQFNAVFLQFNLKSWAIISIKSTNLTQKCSKLDTHNIISSQSENKLICSKNDLTDTLGNAQYCMHVNSP